MIIILFVFVFMSLPNLGYAQQDTTQSVKAFRIILHDGSSFIGTIESEDDTSVNFRTLSDMELIIKRDQIESIKPLIGTISGKMYYRTDPNSTRLLFAPTARTLKSGQGYISLYELFFPFIAVGIGNVVSLSGGISLFTGAPEQLYYLAPKITPIQLENLDLAAGLINLGITGGGGDGVGIYYVVGTWGPGTSALTFGLGWGYASGYVADEAIVMIGGELQLSNSFKLITENWFPPVGDFALISFGFRFFGERLASDIGFFTPAGVSMEGWPFFPMVNCVYNFGG